MILTTIICIILLILARTVQKYYKYKGQDTILKKTVLMLTVLLISHIIVIISAVYHGADTESLNKFGIIRTIQAIIKSPISDHSNEIAKKGNIIIYYRFGCKDCENIYSELKKCTDATQNIYFIATRQRTGKELLKQYPVDKVPTGIIIQENTYTAYILYENIYIDDIMHTQFNYKGFERLLELQKKEI